MDLIVCALQLRTIHDVAPESSRDYYISPEYVNQYARQIEQANVQLHKKDAISVRLWIDQLKEKNMLVFLKDKITPPPPGSDLDPEAYVLCMQTPFQLDMFQCLGNRFIGIDVTHNMTDCDLVQIKAIKAIYPDSQIFLCIWHVLRTIRSHFVPRKFQSLWAKVKSLECVRERGAEIFVSWKNRFSGVQESILFLDDSLAVFFAERN